MKREFDMERFLDTKKASIMGIVGNIFLFVIKLFVSLITHSQSMIADALNSGTDIASSIMTYIGNKVSSKEADDDHNLGHGKAEYIYSLLISITMIVLGLKVVFDSIIGVFVKNNYVFSKWIIIVCVVTIIIKFMLYLYTNNIYKKHKNLLVLANSKDHRNDCVITLFNLIAGILSYYNILYVDSIIGSLIALWIVITGIDLFRSSYDVLMDKTISEDVKEKVIDIIFQHEEVLKINHFNATPVGYRYQISFTIFVDGNMSTYDSHSIADHLEKEIIKKISEIYLVVIHVNPMDVKKVKKSSK